MNSLKIILPILLFFQINVNPERILGEKGDLFGIRQVVIAKDFIAVLTGNEPYIHIYTHDKVATFGKRGPGPAEFKNPRSICTDGVDIYVVDSQPGNNKLVIFSLSGKKKDEKPLHNIQLVDAISCNKKSGVISDQKINIGPAGQISSSIYSLYRMGDQSFIMKLPSPANITIKPHTGPIRNLSMAPPFRPKPHWALLANGLLAYWIDNVDLVRLSNLYGKTKEEKVLIPDARFRLTKQDIQLWVEKNFPKNGTAFGIENGSSGIQREIFRSINFPDYFPKIGSLVGDPNIGFWIMRAQKPEGEIWSWYRNGTFTTYKFPPNKRVVAFGDDEIATQVESKNGYELIEIYSKKNLKAFLFNK